MNNAGTHSVSVAKFALYIPSQVYLEDMRQNPDLTLSMYLTVDLRWI